MQRTLLALTLGASALAAAAAPAMAQPYGGDDHAQPGYGQPQGYDHDRDRGDEHRDAGYEHRDGDHADFWAGAPVSTDDRIGWLQSRIDAGVRDGSLDRREAYRSQSELRHIRTMHDELRARDGGRMNDADRAYIQGRLDDLSHRIRWQRHNGERAD